MRIIRTGSAQVLDLEFVKNYLKIDPDITIEDDVVSLAIQAAADETDLLLMYTCLMDTFDIVIPKVDTQGKVCVKSFGPVQRVDRVVVKEWGSGTNLVDLHDLEDETEYNFEIDSSGRLNIELTEIGRSKVGKGQFVVVSVLAGMYSDQNQVPASVKKPMLKMIADMVEKRVDVDNTKSGDWRSSDRQIWLHRQWRF